MKQNKLLYITTLFLLFSLLFACKKNKITTSVNTKQTSTTKTYKPIVISGTSKDKKALEYFNILNYSYLYGTNHKGQSKKVSDIVYSNKLDSIDKPQIIELMSFGDDFYNTRVLVSPGDSIKFSTEKGLLQFSGKNASHYNFYTSLDSLQLKWPTFKNNIKQYKDSCSYVYNAKKLFYESYIKNNVVSNDFKSLVGQEIEYEYLYNLMAPRNIKSECSASYFNNTESVFSTVNKTEKLKSEEIFNPKEYFNNVTITDFKKPELINNDYFKRSLTDFIRHYFVTYDYLDYSEKTFAKEKDFIEKNLDGELKHFAISRLIYDYYEKGFGNSKTNVDILNKVINEYKPLLKNTSYVNELTIIQEKMKLLNLELPNIVLDEKLLTIKGDTIQLKDILKQSEDKIKVIAFWASWCGPCITEIKKSSNFKNNLSKKQPINWIYISIDENQKQWLQKSKTLESKLEGKEQYLLLNNKYPKLLKYLRVETIPRYSILNKNNEIILENAPRPSDSINFNRIINKIASTK
ncbi:MAG: thioredoxin-like domain-containing protein [Cellulophaga sp.]|uniref:TlpA family protein disulfide reductase n=1 Tax=Cellulophaga sp. TaxID=1972202 RepID=UPI00326465E0